MITLYTSSVASNVGINKQQQRMKMILDGKKIKYTEVDVASSVEDKEKMRELAGDPSALPPQIANGDKYCGNYELFEEAVENEELEKFLKIDAEN